MYGKITDDRELLRKRYPTIFNDENLLDRFAGRVCDVEKRVFEGGKLVGYVVFFGVNQEPFGKLGDTFTFDADLVKVEDEIKSVTFDGKDRVSVSRASDDLPAE